MAGSVKQKYEAIIRKVLENGEAKEVVKALFGGSSDMEFINVIMNGLNTANTASEEKKL